jgi:endonuclease/exonuclease/phosphatase family metal-dependent hydrolase
MNRSRLAARASAFVTRSRATNHTDPLGPSFAGAYAAADAVAKHVVRVVTFNIAFARQIDRSIALFQQAPELQSADVVALQEMDEEGTDRLARAVGLNYVYFPATVHPQHGRNFGNAVLSRWPLEEPTKSCLPHEGRFNRAHRIAVAATVVRPDARIRTVSLHLSTILEAPRGARRAQALAALDIVGPHYTHAIVAGDVNGSSIGEVFERHGYVWGSRGLGRTIKWFAWDHIFLRGFRVASAGVVRDNRGASDHRPVWAELEIEQP